MELAIPGVSSVDDLYTTFTDDKRVARALYYAENLRIARHVGLFIPKNRFTEIELIKRTRAHVMGRLGPRTCSGCVLEGRRWYKINSGEPLLYRLDRTALTDAYSRAVECFDDVFDNLQRLRPELLFREARVGEVADVDITAQVIDGRFNTLGFATTFTTQDSDDLDVGGDRWVSAQLVMDQAELWDYNFCFTVASHELIHIFGVGHASQALDDIQVPQYVGDRRDYGVWTMNQFDQRYVGVPA